MVPRPLAWGLERRRASGRHLPPTLAGVLGCPALRAPHSFENWKKVTWVPEIPERVGLGQLQGGGGSVGPGASPSLVLSHPSIIPAMSLSSMPVWSPLRHLPSLWVSGFCQCVRSRASALPRPLFAPVAAADLRTLSAPSPSTAVPAEGRGLREGAAGRALSLRWPAGLSGGGEVGGRSRAGASATSGLPGSWLRLPPPGEVGGALGFCSSSFSHLFLG